MHPEQHFIIITGGPGVGKTTLLNALKVKGFEHVAEVARAIIKEQVQSGGDALPWENKAAYSAHMLQRSIETYNSALNTHREAILFFDRGIPDTLVYCKLAGITVTPELESAVNQYRYYKKVFILPPWEEIYTTDPERKQDFQEAVETFNMLLETYRRLGYQLIEVPKMEVDERVNFVLENAVNRGDARAQRII